MSARKESEQGCQVSLQSRAGLKNKIEHFKIHTGILKAYESNGGDLDSIASELHKKKKTI